MDSVRPPNDYEKSLLEKKGYTIIEPAISGGSYASVFKALRNGQKIAVKLIDCERNSEDYRYKFLPKELYVLQKLNHPFITTVYEFFIICNRVFIFMELLAGDAIDMLNSEGPLKESKCKVLFKQISSALQYMHSSGIAHRDLKCENILLNESQTIAKLTDFGYSRIVFDQFTGRKILTQTHCGSVAYVSPEILCPGPIDAIRADCWSIGVVLFVFLNNKLPFNEKDNQIVTKQKTKNYVFAKALSSESKDLISQLLEPDIRSRYTMKQVLNHPWLINVKI